MRWNRRQLREHLAKETAELNKTIDNNRLAYCDELQRKLNQKDAQIQTAITRSILVGLILGAAIGGSIAALTFSFLHRADQSVGFWRWLGL